MKKKLLAFIITCVMITGVISNSYMQSHAMSTVGAVDVIYTILLALGVKTEINLKQVDADQKQAFVQSVVQSFNQKEAGLGTELQTFAESAIRYGLTATLSVQQSLWNRLLSATTSTDGLNFHYVSNKLEMENGYNGFVSFLQKYGINTSVQPGSYNSLQSFYNDFKNDTPWYMYNVIQYGNEQYIWIVGAEIAENIVKNGETVTTSLNGVTRYIVYNVGWNQTTVSRMNAGANQVFAYRVNELTLVGSTDGVQTSIDKSIPSQYELIKRANMYDVATKGRLWDSQTDTMSGDVVLTIPATGVEDISESVSSETETLESAQSKIGVKAVNKAQGLTITDSIPIEEAITDQTEIYDSDINNYTLSLTSFFPFCIPWDIYDMLSAFVAEPETPSFVFNFPTGVINHQIQWTECRFDLHQWDGVAQGMRVLETISFTIGLAMITRNYFLRG